MLVAATVRLRSRAPMRCASVGWERLRPAGCWTVGRGTRCRSLGVPKHPVGSSVIDRFSGGAFLAVPKPPGFRTRGSGRQRARCGTLSLSMANYPRPRPQARPGRAGPAASQPPPEALTADAGCAGGFAVGIMVGVVIGVVLAALGFCLWYQGHCGQVPFIGVCTAGVTAVG